MLYPFKNRTINRNKPVKVYRNLHNGLFSLVQGTLVVAHADELQLTGATFKVNEAGRQRVLRERKKNVHAFVIGYLCQDSAAKPSATSAAITYNPYKYSGFVWRDSGAHIDALTQTLNMSNTEGMYTV